MRARLQTCLLLLVAIAAATAARAQEPKQRISLDDFLEWEHVESPVISPDGRHVIYTRRSVDAINDRWRSELWVVGADGTQNRFLTSGAGVVWSPDGTRIAYTAPGDPRGIQIFVRWMDEAGTTTQITRVPSSPRFLRWSPDGESIAFRMGTPKPKEPWDLEMPAPPPGADWVAAPRIGGVGYPAGVYNHIYVVPAVGGRSLALTEGASSYNDPEWSRDGSTIFATANRDSALQIYAIDVATRDTRQLTAVLGDARRPKASPDGRLVAYVGWHEPRVGFENPELYVMNTDGSDPRALLGGLDRRIRGLWWAPDNSGLYFGAFNHGRVNVYFAPLSGEGAQSVTEGDHRLQPGSMSTSGRVAAQRSDATESAEVVVFDVQRPDDVRKLTDVNGDLLAERRLGETEEIWYASYDGLEIQGWIVKPPDFDPAKKYPFVLGIHGGPHAMMGFGGGGLADYWLDGQYLASRGYVGLYTNPRGSTGYGSAFADAVTNRFPGEADYQDLMFGVDAVIDRGYIDTDNMFVQGCSAGGTLTGWIVGHTDRFAAASANCFYGNWIAAAAQQGGGMGFGYELDRPYWEDPTLFLEHSPIMFVENVTTPTLLIVGAEDRVAVTQAREFYNALTYLDVPTALVVLTDEGHGFHDRPSNYIRTWAMMHSWFQRWSNGENANGGRNR